MENQSPLLQLTWIIPPFIILYTLLTFIWNGLL
jgi:hypothetical protein